MTTASEFEKIVKKSIEKALFSKTDKKTLKDALVSVFENASATEKKTLTKIKDIITSGDIGSDEKKTIKSILPKVLEILEKYAEVDESDGEEVEVDESEEEIDEEIEEEVDEEESEEEIDVKTPADVKKLLDETVPIYSGFSKENPMRGVTWDKSKKIYKVTCDGKTVNVKDINEACQKSLVDKKGITSSQKIPIEKSFLYQNQYFLSFWIGGEPYFDIQHIISVLKLQKRALDKKYSDFKKDIITSHWDKNEFGGYIERELIAENTMFNIILSSRSKLAIL